MCVIAMRVARWCSIAWRVVRQVGMLASSGVTCLAPIRLLFTQSSGSAYSCRSAHVDVDKAGISSCSCLALSHATMLIRGMRTGVWSQC